MTSLAATAHIGIIINTPSDKDIANLQQLIKMAMTLIAYLILVWRELQPLILFVVSVLEVLEVAVKVIVIIWNVLRWI